MFRLARRAPAPARTHKQIRFSTQRYAQLPENDKVAFIHGRRLHWICREGTWPLILDARPAADHQVYSIMGSVSFPFDTSTEEDIKSLPSSRSVYLHAGDRGEYENQVVDFALKIQKSHPSVYVVQGGPTEIRKSGFMYTCDYPRFEEREAQKKREKEAAAKAAAEAANAKK